MSDANIIQTILERATTQVTVRKNIEAKLASGEKLRIKLGIDPTGFDLTLGHAVVLRKLQQFKNAGHQIVLIFGTFTAQIGDPTGKSETRTPLSLEQIQDNAKNYIQQAGKVLDMNGVEVAYNGDWLAKMDFAGVLKLAGCFTVAQMMERDMFQERVKKNREIKMVEFMYPLMQGYDSVAIRADIEIGGNDQYFNLLCGRPIQEKYGQKPQDVLTTKIIVGTDGKEKMSKSLENYIAIQDPPNEIFGKIMSIPDETMYEYFECLTDVDLVKAKKMMTDNPRDAKIILAKDIITWLYDANMAASAAEDFSRKFVEKGIPDNMPSFTLSQSEIGILDLVTKICKFAGSNSQARQLVIGGGITWDNEKIENPQEIIIVSTSPKVLKVGKRNFAKILMA